jgi:hypothetical protein
MVSGSYGDNGILVRGGIYDTTDAFIDENIVDGDPLSFEPDLFNILLRPNISDTDYGSVFVSLPSNKTHFILWQFNNGAGVPAYYYEKPNLAILKYASIAPIHPTTFVMYYTDSLATIADFYAFDVCGDAFVTGSEQCVPGSIGCLTNCTCDATEGYQPFNTPQADCAPGIRG